MAVSRSVAQQQLDAEYQRIKSRRNREVGMLAALEFISAVSTSLVMADMLGLMGISISAVLALTAASLLFFGLLGVTILCGVLCAIFIIQEGKYKKDSELALMQTHATLVEQQASNMEKLKILLGKTNDPFMKARYEKILRNGDVINTVRELNGHLKMQTGGRLRDMLLLPKREKIAVQKIKKISPPNYKLSNVIAFFSGAGLMLGISASIIGASALPALLLTPAGWVVLAAVLLLAISAGVVMAYSDYCLRQSQQAHIESLEEDIASASNMNKTLKETIIRVEAELARSPDETTLRPFDPSTSSGLRAQGVSSGLQPVLGYAVQPSPEEQFSRNTPQ